MRDHTKSRRGCINCKARRVRCTEEHPTCAGCARRGLSCEYSTLPISFDRHNARLPATKVHRGPRMELLLTSICRSPSPGINATDQMFLIHYCEFATMPAFFGTDGSIWMREVAARAHEDRLVMNAVLALSSSHLTRNTAAAFGETGLHYRQRALAGINESLVNLGNGHDANLEQAEALFVATRALFIQSMYLDEAAVDEFIPLMSGLGALSALPVMQRSSFLPRARDYYAHHVKSKVFDYSEFDADEATPALHSVMRAAERSIVAIGPVCRRTIAWYIFHRALLCRVQNGGCISPTIEIETWEKPEDELLAQLEVAPRLLMIHLLALGYLFERPQKGRPLKSRLYTADTRIGDWIRRICEPLQSYPELIELARWPLRLTSALEEYDTASASPDSFPGWDLVQYHPDLLV